MNDILYSMDKIIGNSSKNKLFSGIRLEYGIDSVIFYSAKFRYILFG